MTLPFLHPSRYRLALVIGSVVALLVASLAVAGYNERQYQAQTRQAVNVQAQVLADTVAAALSFGDRDSLRQYVDAMRNNAEVEAVGVYDEGGRLVVSYGHMPPPDSLASLNAASAAGQVAVQTPVLQKGERLGVVYVRDRTEPVMRRLVRYLGPGLLLVMALLMFLVMALDSRALLHANRALTAEIAERAKAEAALRQSQKMEAIGRLTGGIAHDFNNMLAIVLGSLDLLIRRHPDADARLLRLAGNAAEGARRASGLTQRLLAFSRLQPLNPSAHDISKSIKDMSDLLRRTLGEDVTVETVSAAGLWRAHIDLSQLETAIINLAINARDAMSAGGKLTIETANTYLDRAYTAGEEDVTPGQYVMVAVSDTGAGIPPEVLAQVFEPFFTTKPPGLGTGLGLSQVHGFIKQSGGHIRIYSEVGVGTTVKLYLPRSMAEVAAERPVALKSAGERRRDVTVLLAEDEDGVREFAIEALSELGFDVVAADGASAALELLQEHPEVSLLLTDVVMPHMNGRQLAQQALRLRPSLQVVFMTGYTRNAIVHNGVLDAGTHLISKPFTVAQLGAELDAVLAG
jgi:signal transduction histidine kinase